MEVVIKTGIFGQPDPKVHIWQMCMWRIEFSYSNIRIEIFANMRSGPKGEFGGELL